MNKRGASKASWIIISIVISIAVIIFAVSAMYYFRDTITAGLSQGYTNLGDLVGGSVDVGTKTVLNVLSYIVGPVPNQIVERTPNEISAIIIVIAMWFLLFITFSDIFQSFSTFRPEVSWIIGGLLALMAANLNGVAFLVICFSAVFITIGTLGVFVGLFGAIIAFVIVNLGITSAGTWIMKRKMLIDSSRKDIATEQGAKDVKAAIGALKEVREGFAKKP